MLSESELNTQLNTLLSMSSETETVEFKKAESTFSDSDLGKYFSALSNEANLKGIRYAWLVLGVDNASHRIIGTQYKPTRLSLDETKKKIADQTTNRITFEEIHVAERDGKRVVMFQIPAAPRGIPVAYQGHYYGRDGESLVALNLHELEVIRGQRMEDDWSCQTVDDATLSDLDSEAIQKARQLYLSAHSDKQAEMEEWDDATFLNKAKITIKGKITNAAILLLGKPESDVLISPAVAQIKWILKDANGMERDYEIFSCPFIFAVDKVYSRIRNLKYRYINPEFQTLFPEEIDTYEPYVIREAINNAIAHQDYRLGGQINVVEYDDKLVFSNKGSFIPGKIDNVLLGNAPEEHYRNRFLCNAMVGLKMVDTIGSGIRKMYTYQRKRLFPMPVYDLSQERIQVTITGKIIDMNYANQLLRNPNLTLMGVELLNRVQMKSPLSKDEIAYLRKQQLVEGRWPNLYISKSVAQTMGQKITYSKHKGLEMKACEELLFGSLRDHKTLSKPEVVELLWNVLPDVFSDDQKRMRIKNLLYKLKKQRKIYCVTQGRNSSWYINQ